MRVATACTRQSRHGDAEVELLSHRDHAGLGHCVPAPFAHIVDQFESVSGAIGKNDEGFIALTEHHALIAAIAQRSETAPTTGAMIALEEDPNLHDDNYIVPCTIHVLTQMSG